MKRRPFAEWCGDQIEEVCARNDGDRPGHETKLAWETLELSEMYTYVDGETFEFIEAYLNYCREPTIDNREKLQWECADAAATLLMMSANVDPEMQKLRRGR